MFFLSWQLSQEPTFVPGVWGPYFCAMVPSLWLNEGGQSVTGKLVRPQIFLEYSCVEIINITIIIIMAFFDNDDWTADTLSPSSSFTLSLSINREP